MHRKLWIGWTLLLAALLAQGCTGCVDRVLDRIEAPLRSDPGRGGKVGTLRALEVSQNARAVARRMGLRAGGPCDIGWDDEKPFALSFTLAIDVERGRWQRRWLEEGRFEQDQQGNWRTEGRADYEEGDQFVGGREYQVFADDEGFYEWLGPEVAGRHQEGGEVQRWWRREFTSRFASLMQLTAVGWSEVDEGRWVPGEQYFACGPESEHDARGWRAILGARGEREGAEIYRYTQGDQRHCRRLESEYRLGDGGSLQVSYAECLEEGPERLENPGAPRVFDVGGDRHRSGGMETLEKWIGEGLVVPVEDENED